MRFVSTLIAAIALSGCATQYQAQGLTGGFTDVQLSDDTFQVTFKGNGMTSPDRVEELSLLRCAELTLKNGFTHFVVLDKQNFTKTSSHTTAATATTTGRADQYTGQINLETKVTPGQTTYVNKPGTTKTIMAFKGKPANMGVVYDAAMIYDSLAAKNGAPPRS